MVADFGANRFEIWSKMQKTAPDRIAGSRRLSASRHLLAAGMVSLVSMLFWGLSAAGAANDKAAAPAPEIEVRAGTRQIPAGTPARPYRRMARQQAFIAHICRRIEVEARASKLPAAFLVRLIWLESRFDPNAISPKGARGIAQFMPGTARLRGLADPFDARSAIAASARYLGELRDEFGNLGFAAAAYNAGEQGVRNWRAGKSRLPHETEDYVFVITGYTSDKWNKADTVNADYTLDRDLTVQAACRALPVRRAPPQPRYAYAHNNQGVSYCASGQYDRAIAHYDRAIQIRPRFAKAFFNRALAYRSKGEFDQAIADYNAAIKLKPGYAEAYNNRGVAHHKKADFDRAIADYTSALKRNPAYVSAYHNRAVAFRAKGRYVKAIADLNSALKLNPKHALALVNRGLTYVKIKQNVKAIADFRKAVTVRPGHRAALRALKRLGAAP